MHQSLILVVNIYLLYKPFRALYKKATLLAKNQMMIKPCHKHAGSELMGQVFRKNTNFFSLYDNGNVQIY